MFNVYLDAKIVIKLIESKWQQSKSTSKITDNLSRKEILKLQDTIHITHKNLETVVEVESFNSSKMKQPQS